jgi:hypothetical protein
MFMSHGGSPEVGPPPNLAVGIIKALRPRQWIKNILVVAAPLATLGGHVHYDYRDVFSKVGIAFVVCKSPTIRRAVAGAPPVCGTRITCMTRPTLGA